MRSEVIGPAITNDDQDAVVDQKCREWSTKSRRLASGIGIMDSLASIDLAKCLEIGNAVAALWQEQELTANAAEVSGNDKHVVH